MRRAVDIVSSCVSGIVTPGPFRQPNSSRGAEHMLWLFCSSKHTVTACNLLAYLFQRCSLRRALANGGEALIEANLKRSRVTKAACQSPRSTTLLWINGRTITLRHQIAPSQTSPTGAR